MKLKGVYSKSHHILGTMHHIEKTHTKSFTNRQSCVVMVKVSQRFRTIAQIDDYEFRVVRDIKHVPTYSIPKFSFSFDELYLPWKCKDQFNEQLSRMQHDMNPTTTQYLVNEIVDYATNLVCGSCKEHNNFGYIVEAKLVIVHLQLSDIGKGRYEQGNREEAITCSVCLNDVENGMAFTRFQCSHIFHCSCAGRWLEKNTSCPNCRYKLKDKLSVEEGLADRLILDDHIARLPYEY